MSAPLTSNRQPKASLGCQFRLAHRRFRALLDGALENLGVTPQQYAILSAFETRPELSSAELARIAQVARQTMHAAVIGLETVGLLERTPKNQRVVLVRRTRQGRSTLNAATDRVRVVERTALDGLSRAEQHVVRTWLAKRSRDQHDHSTDQGQVKEKRTRT